MQTSTRNGRIFLKISINQFLMVLFLTRCFGNTTVKAKWASHCSGLSNG